MKPPCTERYARWCERTGANHSLLLDVTVKINHLIFPGWIWGQTCRRRPRKKLSADRCRCHHCQGQYSCRPYSYSTPTVLWRWHALRTSGHCELKPPLDTCSRSRLLACFPRCVFLFRRSFCFQGTVHR